MSIIFYRKKLYPRIHGTHVITEKWASIHETECFHFCVNIYDLNNLNDAVIKDEIKTKTAKRLYMAVKRVDKRGSRFAFETEEQALRNLIYLKTLQVQHMKYDLKIIEQFLANPNGPPVKAVSLFETFRDH